MKRENPSTKPDKSLLIFDSKKSHLTDYLKASVKECSKMAVISGGLTKLFQPSFNRWFERPTDCYSPENRSWSCWTDFKENEERICIKNNGKTHLTTER